MHDDFDDVMEDHREYLKKINSLSDLLDNEESYKKINATVDVNRIELFFMILKFAHKCGLAHSALSALVCLINNIFDKPILPESRYKLDKIFNCDDNTSYHAICPNCQSYLGNINDLKADTICSECKRNIDCSKPSSDHFFSVVDPSKRIAELLNIHGKYYNWVMNERKCKQGVIRDIYDGLKYQNFFNNILPPADRKSYATAILNTDGAVPFKFSKKAAWPVYLTINELPPQDRMDNVIVCGSWFAKSKPNINAFLSPLFNILNKCAKDGIKVIVQGEERIIKLYTIACSVDAQCRCSMQGTKQCNGYFGCPWCIHPGKADSFSKGVRYPVIYPDPQLRDHSWMSKLMYCADQDSKWIPVFGVKKPSVLLKLSNFDIVDGLIVDYMHCVLIGVAKKIVNLLLGVEDMDTLSKLSDTIKLPSHVRRMTRPLNERAHWVAKDWENFLLFQSLPLMKVVCDKDNLRYWSQLVEATHILLGTEITTVDLNNADRLLRSFVWETQEKFTITAMVFNIHQLIHIVKTVMDWGPLWATSNFSFESANHYIVQAIKNARGAPMQIQRYVNLGYCISLLQQKLIQHSSERVKNFVSTVIQKKIRNVKRFPNDILYFGKTCQVPENLARQFNLSPHCKTYQKMIKNKCLYVSSDIENKRSDNSTVHLFNGQYVRIKYFVEDINNEQQIFIYQNLITRNHDMCEGAPQVKIVENVDDQFKLANVSEIKTICAYYKITDEKFQGVFVCALPNLINY